MTTYAFQTENSTYEIDDGCEVGETNPVVSVRRLSGVNDPTPRQGVDGEWKTLAVPIDPSTIQIGDCILFVWRFEDGVAKSTVTSQVTAIAAPDL